MWFVRLDFSAIFSTIAHIVTPNIISVRDTDVVAGAGVEFGFGGVPHLESVVTSAARKERASAWIMIQEQRRPQLSIVRTCHVVRLENVVPEFVVSTRGVSSKEICHVLGFVDDEDVRAGPALRDARRVDEAGLKLKTKPLIRGDAGSACVQKRGYVVPKKLNAVVAIVPVCDGN